MAKLYIVGTPIGNMNDMTFRAVETLRAAEVIACEDTRHSLPLLNRYEIKDKQLLAYHKFNETECSQKIVELIRAGKNVALITDAGMPCISDPGAVVVEKCREEGVETELVPGPSALTGALALSGIQGKGFTFLGFLPEKKKDKVSIVSKFADCGLPVVFYVAPHDLTKTAAFLLEVLGDRRVRVCRELTKIYESVTITTLASFECEERGEIVLIVEPAEEKNPDAELTVEEHLKSLIEGGLDKKEAVKTVASLRGLTRNEVYQIALTL